MVAGIEAGCREVVAGIQVYKAGVPVATHAQDLAAGFAGQFHTVPDDIWNVLTGRLH